MVELHGWALIRESYTVDNEDANLAQIVEELRREINRIDADDRLIGVNYSNSEACLIATRCTNHFSEDIAEVIELFETVARIAPGSYGLLYIRNDEDIARHNNAFRAYVLSRGSLRLQQDPFLSPCIPMIED